MSWIPTAVGDLVHVLSCNLERVLTYPVTYARFRIYLYHSLTAVIFMLRLPYLSYWLPSLAMPQSPHAPVSRRAAALSR